MQSCTKTPEGEPRHSHPIRKYTNHIRYHHKEHQISWTTDRPLSQKGFSGQLDTRSVQVALNPSVTRPDFCHCKFLRLDSTDPEAFRVDFQDKPSHGWATAQQVCLRKSVQRFAPFPHVRDHALPHVLIHMTLSRRSPLITLSM